MGDLSFGFTIDMLKNAMTGSAETHSAITNNIVNMNTPNFKRSDVSFKSALAGMETSAAVDSDELAMATTDGRHIQAGPTTEPQPFSVSQTVDDTQIMRQDGSNVDLDQEMAKLSLNSAYSQAMGQLLGVQYMRIRQAIQEHS